MEAQRSLVGVGVGLTVSAAVGGASLIAQGPLPADVWVTRLLQTLFGDHVGWARYLTASAHVPGLWPTLFVATSLAAVRGGRRAALLPSLALIVVLLVDRGLRALVFAPRPDAALVEVASVSAGSGLPSTFALVYGALFGGVLFARARTGGRRRAWDAPAFAIAVGAILSGGAARIALGGHWASQIVASLALASAIVLALRVAIDAARRRGVERSG